MGIWARMMRKDTSRTGGRSRMGMDPLAIRDGFTLGGHRLPSLYRNVTTSDSSLTKRCIILAQIPHGGCGGCETPRLGRKGEVFR